MARQSFAGDVSREEGLEIFSNRLASLAEAHNLLVRSDWLGADFRELAERQVRPYAKGGDEKVILKGPRVLLPPDIATPVALVLHELATNALKFGAFSVPAGTVSLNWGFKSNGKEREFQIVWRESGMDGIKPPSKQGFGTWLIKNGTPEAKVDLNFLPAGAVCKVTLPMEMLQADESEVR
jgi:two-component system, chemotaxis family, CheB/CheR fusion protein